MTIIEMLGFGILWLGVTTVIVLLAVYFITKDEAPKCEDHEEPKKVCKKKAVTKKPCASPKRKR